MRDLRRKAILCGLLMTGVWHAGAQILISRKIEQGGKVFDAGHIFTSPEPLTLSLTDGSMSGVWEMEILKDYGIYETVTPISTFEDHCVIDPLAIGFRDTWRDARRYYDEELNRDLFRVRVSFVSDKGIEDHIILNLGLLPTRPVVSDVVFTYIYDWERDAILPNGDLSFDMETEDADRCWLNVSDTYLFEFPDFFTWCAEFDIAETGATRIGYDADWGEYFAVQVKNTFGYVWSDTYCTTSYIHDEDILERLEELKRKAGVDTVTSDPDEAGLTWDNSALTFDRRIEQIYVCDINGREVYSNGGVESVDLSGIARGVYVAVYRSENKLSKTKIIKK